jgi:hypothetical protein
VISLIRVIGCYVVLCCVVLCYVMLCYVVMIELIGSFSLNLTLLRTELYTW